MLSPITAGSFTLADANEVTASSTHNEIAQKDLNLVI